MRYKELLYGFHFRSSFESFMFLNVLCEFPINPEAMSIPHHNAQFIFGLCACLMYSIAA